MTSMRENVWIEISGLPPKKLPEYYEKYDFERLARKMIFGTDWPGVPGLKKNALALFDLDLEPETVELVLHENAERVYKLDAKQERKDIVSE
jgi:predicted TIM-barrel fold metal-dependent hydrolase